MAPVASTVSRSQPISRATTGFLQALIQESRFFSTASPGLRDTMAMYFTSVSASRAAMPISIIRPPT